MRATFLKSTSRSRDETENLFCEYVHITITLLALFNYSWEKNIGIYAVGVEVITDIRLVQGRIKNTTSSVAIVSRTKSIHKTVV